MKLSLMHSLSLFGAAGLALAALGCSGSNSTNLDGSNGGADGGAPGPADPPHALGMITLAEMHAPSGGASTPVVSAVFVPDAAKSATCSTTLAGCSIPMVPLCDGRNGPICQPTEVCTLDTACRAVCQKPCTMTCASDEECYWATPSAQACRRVESFDAGALAFAGTTTPITLYPPYSFVGETSGAPFLAGSTIEVQGSGATVAGFDKFDETFKATTFVQTVPSLDKIPLAQIWGPGDIPVGWLPGSDAIVVSVSGALGMATCNVDDTRGAYAIPRAVVNAVTGAESQTLSISVTRERVETKKDGKTKGTLSTATVQPVGFLQLTTSSTESASYEGCPTGYAMCGAGCVDLTTSSTDCGACGHSCGGGYCSGGTCFGTTNGCTGGLTSCNGSCVDTTTSATNCGYCGNVCPSGDTCSGSTCVSSTQTCSTCASNAETGTCAKPYNTCANDTSCVSLWNCVSGCASGDSTCRGNCYNAYPSGYTNLSNLQSCVCNTACTSACSGDPYCSPI